MRKNIDVEGILRQSLDYPNPLELALLSPSWAKKASLKDLAIGATAYFEATWALEIPEELTTSLDTILDSLEAAMADAPLQSSSPESDEFWWLILASGYSLDRNFEIPQQSRRVYGLAVTQLEMAAGSPVLADVQFHFVTSVASYLDTESHPDLANEVKELLEVVRSTTASAEVRSEVYDVLNPVVPTIVIEEDGN